MKFFTLHVLPVVLLEKNSFFSKTAGSGWTYLDLAGPCLTAAKTLATPPPLLGEQLGQVWLALRRLLGGLLAVNFPSNVYEREHSPLETFAKPSVRRSGIPADNPRNERVRLSYESRHASCICQRTIGEQTAHRAMILAWMT